MNGNKNVTRRKFVRNAAGGAALLPVARAEGTVAGADNSGSAAASGEVSYPRTFRGGNLRRIAFPLGGVAAGSISLGGRGQLRDWEIFNRPDKGN